MALILVLDDDSEVCEMIELTLKPQGHEVLCAASIEKAQEFINQRVPHLLLLDLLLDDEDGLQYMQQLAQQQRTQDIPVIVVSAIRHPRSITEFVSQTVLVTIFNIRG